MGQFRIQPALILIFKNLRSLSLLMVHKVSNKGEDINILGRRISRSLHLSSWRTFTHPLTSNIFIHRHQDSPPTVSPRKPWTPFDIKNAATVLPVSAWTGDHLSRSRCLDAVNNTTCRRLLTAGVADAESRLAKFSTCCSSGSPESGVGRRWRLLFSLSLLILFWFSRI